MELQDVWMLYCADRFGGVETLPELKDVTPWQAVELFFEAHPLFAPRWDAINATPYSTAFDEEADNALLMLAMKDSFASWEQLSAGAWRVLSERLMYAEVVALANEAAKEPIIGGLPIGLDRQSEARALLLMFLLGGARTIDRRVLPVKLPGEVLMFPGNTLLKRQ